MSHSLTVIDIGIGNVASVMKALQKAGGKPQLMQDIDSIVEAEKLVFPGVGAFGAGAQALDKLGLVAPIRHAVLEKKIPILGLCMGMQLFAQCSYEKGVYPGLGLLPVEVKPLDIAKCDMLPHMGWNNLESTNGMRMFDGLPASPHFYFVHSYHMVDLPETIQASYCYYGEEKVTAAIQMEHIYGTQFHPEKSLSNGIHILKKFIEDA